MSRVIKTIEIEGQPVKALFDTGAFHSYVLRQFLESVPMRPVVKPYKVALGGETIKIRERALVYGMSASRNSFFTKATTCSSSPRSSARRETCRGLMVSGWLIHGTLMKR